MKKTVTCFIAALSVCLLVLAGCGEEKTIYEDGTDGGGVTTTTAGGGTTTTTGGATTTTAGGGTTTTTVAGPLNGQAQYEKTCKGCHPDPTHLTARTVQGIKAAGMAFGLDDTQLQKVSDYLLTLP